MAMTPSERQRIAEEFAGALGDEAKLAGCAHYIRTLLASLAAAGVRAHNAEGLLAGLADCINQELRENGPVDVPQVTGYLGAQDMRHFIRLLVDEVKQRQAKSVAAVEAERDRLQSVVRTNEWQASFQSRYEEAEAELALLRTVAEAVYQTRGLNLPYVLYAAYEKYVAWQRTQEERT